VGTSLLGPSDVPQDAVIVIGQFLSPQLHRKAIAQEELTPSLVDARAMVAHIELRLIAPDPDILEDEPGPEMLAEIVQIQAAPLLNKKSRVLFLFRKASVTVTVLGTRSNLSGKGELGGTVEGPKGHEEQKGDPFQTSHKQLLLDDLFAK
jgi:hypothetical protein